MKTITKLVLPLAVAVSMLFTAAPVQAQTAEECLAIIVDLQGDIEAITIAGPVKGAERLRKELRHTLKKAGHELADGDINQTAKEIVVFSRKLKAAGRAGLIAPAVVAHLVGDDAIELLECLIELEDQPRDHTVDR